MPHQKSRFVKPRNEHNQTRGRSALYGGIGAFTGTVVFVMGWMIVTQINLPFRELFTIIITFAPISSLVGAGYGYMFMKRAWLIGFIIGLILLVPFADVQYEVYLLQPA